MSFFWNDLQRLLGRNVNELDEKTEKEKQITLLKELIARREKETTEYYLQVKQLIKKEQERCQLQLLE